MQGEPHPNDYIHTEARLVCNSLLLVLIAHYAHTKPGHHTLTRKTDQVQYDPKAPVLDRKTDILRRHPVVLRDLSLNLLFHGLFRIGGFLVLHSRCVSILEVVINVSRRLLHFSFGHI